MARSFLGQSNQRVIFSFMGEDQLQAELSLAKINWNPILTQVEERTAALDRYVASIRKEDHSWSTLRKRMASLFIMGFVPFLAALVSALLLGFGVISSENEKALAGFVIIGCGFVVLLALSAIVHVALQGAFHAHLLRRSAEERCWSFANATVELYRSDSIVGRGIVQHFRSKGLGDYFQEIHPS
jgi:hypothetical protein